MCVIVSDLYIDFLWIKYTHTSSTNRDIYSGFSTSRRCTQTIVV